jgi:hypothetical protein
MAVRRRSGPKMRSSRQGDGAGSRESKPMVTPTLSTNTNLVSPPHACRKSRQRLRVYDKEMVRYIIPTLAHCEWGTPFCFLFEDAYRCS